MSSEHLPTTLLTWTLLLSAGLAASSGCLEVQEEARLRDDDPCTSCHGEASREQPRLLRAAPPFDVKGNQDTEYPGVGAHRHHLTASPSHDAVPCDECHRVPSETLSEGHIDSAPPAELHFGPLARRGDQDPVYDEPTRRCSNTYCHGPTSPPWTRPRSSERACGSCHALPPVLPHPASSRCSVCHGEVIDEAGSFVNRTLHGNGRVEVDEPLCTSCHGSEANAAPPIDLEGNRETSARGVGAHQVHLSGGRSRPMDCEECHVVPETAASPGHLDGEGVRVRLTGIAAFDATGASLGVPEWQEEDLTCSATWCHGPGARYPAASAIWTSGAGPLDCASCHGMPPMAPHPQVENCSLCHAPVVRSARHDIDEPERHVDGQVTSDQPSECTSCHGTRDGNPLGPPPRDTQGNEQTSAPGVGAHAAHGTGNGRARPLSCDECHRVPDEVNDPGHIDTRLPAELRFEGVAQSFDADPVYANGRCASTYCHGDQFIGNRPSGGTHTTPDWTRVDGSQVTCSGCHGMPPPLPHPAPADDCSECHKNITKDQSFPDPSLHVDGKVTFFLSREDAAEDN